MVLTRGGTGDCTCSTTSSSSGPARRSWVARKARAFFVYLLPSAANNIFIASFDGMVNARPAPGTLLWVSTCCVSLPSRMRLRPRRPCEAITTRSHLFFFTLARIDSAIRSDLVTIALALTPSAIAASRTASTTAWPRSAHCFSVRAMSAVDTVTPPSK